MPPPTTFQLYRGAQLYWWINPEYPEKTTDLPSANDKFYYIMLYRVHLVCALSELTTIVAVGTDYIGSCKSNYNTIRTTTSPSWVWTKHICRVLNVHGAWHSTNMTLAMMHGQAFRIENSQLSSMTLPYRPPLDMLSSSEQPWKLSSMPCSIICMWIKFDFSTAVKCLFINKKKWTLL